MLKKLEEEFKKDWIIQSFGKRKKWTKKVGIVGIKNKYIYKQVGDIDII